MEENVIQINCGILINIDVSVKNIIYEQKFGIQLPVVPRMELDLGSLIEDSITKSDETKGADAEAKSYDKALSIHKETKAIPRNFNKKNITWKTQNFYNLLFMNYHY